MVPRGLIVMGGLAATVIVVAGMRAASGLIGPVFLALVLTIVVHPARHWLAGWRVPDWVSTLICIAIVYAIIVGLSLALVVATARFATLLPKYQAQFEDMLHSLSQWLAKFGVGEDQSKQLLDPGSFSHLASALGSLLDSVLGLASDLFFVLTLVLFLAMDATGFPRHLARAKEARGPLVEALVGFANGTKTYLIVSSIFGLIVAVIDTIALAVMGIPVPLLWGLLAFITNYIPNIGFVIGLIPPAVLGLLEGGPGLFVAVIAVYCLINLVIQTIIQPKIVGDAVGLSTTITFLSLVFWAWVLGALGALLAVPLSLLAKAVLVDVDPKTRWLDPLLSNRAPPEEEEPAAATAVPSPGS
jgi:predicted PurR-regulated permease PerM